MSAISLWTSAGEEVAETPMPDSFKRWVATDGGDPPEDEDWRLILNAVETTLSRKIVQVDSRSLSVNYVFDTKYANGEQDIVRSPRPEILDASVQTQGSIDRFWREVSLHKWLAVYATSLPIPTIRHVIDVRKPDLPRPIVIMDKMPGDVVLNVLGRLPYPAKERLICAYAEQVLALFRLDVPQRIGSPKCSADGTRMAVMPLTAVSTKDCASQVFDTLEDWLASLVAAKAREVASETDAALRRRGERVLARLTTELAAICARLARPAHRRCVLVHDDLNHSNILVDADGNLTAIIDWEYTSIRPAVMAAGYPIFLRYDGLYDPKYEFNKDTFWMASPQDAATLRTLYSEVVKSKDHEYWEALVEGDVLRNAVDYLTKLTSDEGCALLEEWMDTVFARD